HFRDFVEEERSARGFRQHAGKGADRTGEGAFGVAKKLGFDHVCRKGTAVQLHHRPARTRAPAMYFAGEDFLTNSAFAGEEHVRLTRRYSGDDVLHFAHPAADRDRRKVLFGTPKLLPKLLLLLAQMRSFARQ